MGSVFDDLNKEFGKFKPKKRHKRLGESLTEELNKWKR